MINYAAGWWSRLGNVNQVAVVLHHLDSGKLLSLEISTKMTSAPITALQ